MIDGNKHFDEPAEMRASKALADDLKALYTPSEPAPPEIDRVILGQAQRQVAGRQRRRLLWRWAGAVGAAAAVVFVVLALKLAGPEAMMETVPAAPVVREDINRNGRVDILDAFALACRIEEAMEPKSEWDVNEDGTVDRGDVDAVAYAAVRLGKEVL